MLREFRECVVRGHVVDMAVGIGIGTAFGRIVTPPVNEVVMPPIGLTPKGIEAANVVVAPRGGRKATCCARRTAERRPATGSA